MIFIKYVDKEMEEMKKEIAEYNRQIEENNRKIKENQDTINNLLIFNQSQIDIEGIKMNVERILDILERR